MFLAWSRSFFQFKSLSKAYLRADFNLSVVTQPFCWFCWNPFWGFFVCLFVCFCLVFWKEEIGRQLTLLSTEFWSPIYDQNAPWSHQLSAEVGSFMPSFASCDPCLRSPGLWASLQRPFRQFLEFPMVPALFSVPSLFMTTCFCFLVSISVDKEVWIYNQG